MFELLRFAWITRKKQSSGVVSVLISASEFLPVRMKGMEMKKWRDQDLFTKMPGEMPNWMLIRDADNKCRSDKEAKLRAARLAREESGSAEKKATTPYRRNPRPKK